MIALATTNGVRLPTAAPALRVVTRDGERICWAYEGPRYVAEADGVRDHNQGRTLALIEAELRLAKLDVEVARAIGHPLWHVLAPEALSRERAIKAARLQPAREAARQRWGFSVRVRPTHGLSTRA